MISTDKAAMGAFVVLGLLLFGLGLFLIGDRRMLFAKSANYYAEFAQIGALDSGAKVRVGGMDAGEVVDVRVPAGPGEKFRLKFRVIEKLFPVIRTDSVASIQTDGLLGNKFLLIDIGTTGLAPPEYTLTSREPFEIGDLLVKIRETVTAINATVGDVKVNVTHATETVALAAKHVDQIIVSAQDPIERLAVATSKISEDASVIIARVRAGEGTIGKLMNDDSVYNDIAGSAKQIEATLENVHRTSTDVKELVSQLNAGNVPANLERITKNVSESTERLKEMIASFQPAAGDGEGVTGDLRATLSSTREAMSSLAEDLEAMKHGFFFRGFFKDRGFFDLASLSPVEYKSKEFDKTVTKQRVWVQLAELFNVKANGSEELSDPGKKKLDAAMAPFLEYTKDRAVIVEGYAAGGTPAQQFLRSRDRATKVRDYLMKKFTLSSAHMGIMPMGEFAEHSDGIALVLLNK